MDPPRPNPCSSTDSFAIACPLSLRANQIPRALRASVEHLSGRRFWPALPEETAQVLKEKTDEVKIREPKSNKEPE
jgi:hypothetical protein